MIFSPITVWLIPGIITWLLKNTSGSKRKMVPRTPESLKRLSVYPFLLLKSSWLSKDLITWSFKLYTSFYWFWECRVVAPQANIVLGTCLVCIQNLCSQTPRRWKVRVSCSLFWPAMKSWNRHSKGSLWRREISMIYGRDVKLTLLPRPDLDMVVMWWVAVVTGVNKAYVCPSPLTQISNGALCPGSWWWTSPLVIRPLDSKPLYKPPCHIIWLMG